MIQGIVLASSQDSLATRNPLNRLLKLYHPLKRQRYNYTQIPQGKKSRKRNAEVLCPWRDCITTYRKYGGKVYQDASSSGVTLSFRKNNY